MKYWTCRTIAWNYIFSSHIVQFRIWVISSVLSSQVAMFYWSRNKFSLVLLEAGNSTGSSFGVRVPVCRLWEPDFCNLPLFLCNVSTLTPNMLCIVLTHYKKSDALQKTGSHNPQTGTRNPKQEPVLCTVWPYSYYSVRCLAGRTATNQPHDVTSLVNLPFSPQRMKLNRVAQH